MVDEKKYEAIVAKALEGEREPAPGAPTPPDPESESPPEQSEQGGEDKAAKAEHDPYSALKELGLSAEEIRELVETGRNARAMRRESHLRNESVARREERLAELEAKVNATFERDQQLLDTAASLAADDNSEMALQLLKMAGTRARSSAPRTPAAYETQVGQGSEVVKRLERLEQGYQQYAFGDGHSRVTNAAIEAIERTPVFQSERLRKLGIAEKATQSVVESIFRRVQEDPQSLNVFDPRALRNVVQEQVKKEAAFWGDLRDAAVNEYREERKKLNKSAPPGMKGPTTSVRGTPEPQSRPRANASLAEIEDHYATKLAKMLAPKMASEV